MSDTAGSLVDKLVTVNMKLWFSQDELQRVADSGISARPDLVRRLVNLNRQRNSLMTELDSLIDESVKRGGADIDDRTKL